MTDHTCGRIGCDTPVHKAGAFCTECVHWMFDKNPMPPVQAPKQPEPTYPMTNAELAEAIEYALATIGKFNDSALRARLIAHMELLLDVQAQRAKAVKL